MRNVIVDTGFWIALFDPRDQHHLEAVKIAESLKYHNLILPWPTIYETLRTRLVRNHAALKSFEKFLKKYDHIIMDDCSYRDDALKITFRTSLNDNRPLSMVDALIRLIIDDSKVKVSSLITFNVSDFADICRKRNVEIINILQS